MASKLKPVYAKLQKKHRLPSWDDLDSEFEIDTSDEPSSILRHIRRHMCETFEGYTKILEDILHPESAISALYELKVLDEEGKEQLFSIYRRLMMLLRYGLETGLARSDEKDAEFIRQAYKDWAAIKPDFMKVAKKLKSSWENDTDIKEQQAYFG
jgi:hypothetical protein